MSNASALLADLSDEAVLRLEEVCSRFESSWQAGARPSLEDFLAGADGLARLAMLRELLRLEIYYRRRAGENPSAAEYLHRFTEAAPVIEEVFAASSEQVVRQPLPETVDDLGRTAPQAQLPTDADSAAVDGALPTAGSPADASPGRFRPLRFHAAGALGEVYVAEDTELRREVALKKIKQGQASHEESRSRFVLEAETTGRLEHPGIVPVYGLGAYPDGRPYYAMRFIQGESLKAAIGRFHAQTTARFDSLEFRQLLGRFVAVCQAVAYAHSRGVLHRDLKPDNIMLGKFGETLVVDWGLAKVVGREGESLPSGENAPTVGHGETALGRVMGTPAYMSPEQAAGRVRDLGPATDVYSLGATLYAVLTNQPPFQGKVAEVLSQVQNGSWLPALRVNETVPRALDGVCRKAMALRPAERYASALELARDVEQWLGDEPVGAYVEPRNVKLRRWLRKHPRRGPAAAVLLVTAVVGLSLGTVLLGRANRKERESREMFEGQANYFRQELNDDLMLNAGMQPLRYRMLSKVLEDYRQFVEKRPDDLHARLQMVATQRQLGELYLEVDRPAEGRSLLEQAVNSYNELLRQTPAGKEQRFGLAQACQALADLEIQSGDLDSGRKQTDRAIELMEALMAEEPRNKQFALQLAKSFELRATVEGQRGDLEAALADNRRSQENLITASGRFETLDASVYNGAINLFGPLVPGFNQWKPHYLLGRAFANEGSFLKAAGRDSEAAQAYQEALKAYHELLDQNERSPLIRHGMYQAQLDAGLLQIRLGRPAQAEDRLAEAHEQLRQLVRDDPLVKEYKATRLLAAGYLGENLFRLGRTAAAARLLGEVEQQGEQTLGGPARSRRQLARHGWLLHVLGRLEVERGDLKWGLEALQRAQEKMQQALREMPASLALQSNLLTNREALARGRFLKGALTRDAWIVEQREILAQRKALAAEGRRAPQFEGEVATSTAILAGLLLEAGQPAAALVCADEALPSHEQLVREQDELTRPREAPVPKDLRQLTKPNPFVRSIRPFVPSNLELHRQRACLLGRRAAALARVGRVPEAVKAVRQAIDEITSLAQGGEGIRFPPAAPPASLWSFFAEDRFRQEPCYLYDLACHLALASTLPADAKLADPAGRAVQTLHAYAAFGFDNPHKLRTDPSLEPLRKRLDFQTLIQNLEGRSSGRKDTR